MEGPKRGKKNQSKYKKYFHWPLIAFILSITLSMAFGVLSEVALNGANIFIAIAVIIVFLIISIITDMIGVAVTACDIKNFRAMAAKKVRGSKEAIMLKKNADRVSSIFADILGDICSILSGAAGAVVASSLITQNMTDFVGVIVASLVSAVIAALIISGKALMKKYSMEHADGIILILGKILSIFHISRKSKNKSNKNKQKSNKKDKLEKTEETEENNQTESNEEKIVDASTENESVEEENDENKKDIS